MQKIGTPAVFRLDEMFYCGLDHKDSSGAAAAAPAAALPPRPEGGPAVPSTPVPLDETDRKILAELSRDSRQSVTAIAAAVHVSRAHAYARINRLREEGVILRYSTVIDPVRAGLQASAYVTLKLEQNTWRELCAQLQEIPAVHHIALVGGNFDVMLLVRAVDTVHLRQVIFEHVQQLPGVVDTQTFLIFEDIDTRA
ncbi:hypothetical protein KFL01_05920 [Kocuria flava]|uniref:HTH asnC-type domain-containing protein n=1 Tax=Kocuria flava TaxID=446860 RepID=A0ABQ0X1B4_9MICC|nr:hypothetical protein KFL01_05920 [Kocuria flava]